MATSSSRRGRPGSQDEDDLIEFLRDAWSEPDIVKREQRAAWADRLLFVLAQIEGIENLAATIASSGLTESLDAEIVVRARQFLVRAVNIMVGRTEREIHRKWQLLWLMEGNELLRLWVRPRLIRRSLAEDAAALRRDAKLAAQADQPNTAGSLDAAAGKLKDAKDPGDVSGVGNDLLDLLHPRPPVPHSP